ncbi:hypothetical protein Bbelb_427830 [Branchiostoma belcheri]|nr:hypothetical protein Bbelb_427830 [Branchiostoma belcheri]
MCALAFGSPSDMLMIRRSDVRTDANVAVRTPPDKPAPLLQSPTSTGGCLNCLMVINPLSIAVQARLTLGRRGTTDDKPDTGQLIVIADLEKRVTLSEGQTVGGSF